MFYKIANTKDVPPNVAKCNTSPFQLPDIRLPVHVRTPHRTLHYNILLYNIIYLTYKNIKKHY